MVEYKQSKHLYVKHREKVAKTPIYKAHSYFMMYF